MVNSRNFSIEQLNLMERGELVQRANELGLVIAPREKQDSIRQRIAEVAFTIQPDYKNNVDTAKVVDVTGGDEVAPEAVEVKEEPAFAAKVNTLKDRLSGHIAIGMQLSFNEADNCVTMRLRNQVVTANLSQPLNAILAVANSIARV